ncbi:hypothetical protein [uncultured Duncaniella sp.]|uniref:hypothetical protein n=1 Tax=uncultured Duncaniella sp. TaxID=2768039 RepID=UPI0025A93D2C|nr:hypothetical protein [uncultured Duncaniella sp.]
MNTILQTLIRTIFAVVFTTSCALAANAKDDPEDYYVILTLKDGSKVDGYITTALKNYFRPRISEIGVSSEYGGKPQKYTSEEVVSIVFPPNEKDTTTVIYHSVFAQSKMPNYFSKNPKPYKKAFFLRMIYDGDNVKGYVMPLLDRTFAQTMTILNYTWRYFYKTEDSDMAKAYWEDTDGVIPNMKKVMKFYLREFPELQQMVDDGQLTPEYFHKHPAAVLPIIDRIYLPDGDNGQ